MIEKAYYSTPQVIALARILIIYVKIKPLKVLLKLKFELLIFRLVSKICI